MDAASEIKKLKGEVSELRQLLALVLANFDDQLAGIFGSVDQLICEASIKSQRAGEEAQSALLTGPGKLPRCTPLGYKPLLPFKPYRDALAIEEENFQAATLRALRERALTKLLKHIAALEVEKTKEVTDKAKARAEYEAFTDKLAGVVR